MLNGEMRFVGVIGIDGGYNDLTSRMTHPMSFAEIADWYKASREYFAMMVKYDCNVREVRVSVYDADSISAVTAEAIDIKVFRP